MASAAVAAAIVLTPTPAGAATFVVNSNADPGNGVCNAAQCTLREALDLASTTTALDRINFNLPGSHTIQPTSSLGFSEPVILDGFSDPDPARVELDGSLAGAGATGLFVDAGSTVRGLVINRFDQFGMWITGNANVIQGNRIGTNAAGTADLGNGGFGLYVEGDNNRIGGTTLGQGNLISGNDLDGVRILVSGTGNVLLGNRIGTDAAGTSDLGNSFQGITMFGSSGNRIGGQTGITTGGPCTGACNLVSGNNGGIDLLGAASANNIVRGNYVGTNLAGTAAIPNSFEGINIDGSSNTVGGTGRRARNLISGNLQTGVRISGVDATGNSVLGNYIGTTRSGSAALPNGSAGVVILDQATLNTIGGTVAGARNVISGNTAQGVAIAQAGTANNIVAGNYIGLDATGQAALGNGGDGIEISLAGSNTIGGTSPAARNVISGNGEAGVDLLSAGSTVQGNFIGTNAAGTADRGNGEDGVFVSNVPNSTIGGSAFGAGNLISGNQDSGVEVSGSSATGNVVQGNRIGSDFAGVADLGNGGDGVAVNGGSGNHIGGTLAGSGNVISGNGDDGVAILGGNLATANRIRGNRIFSNDGQGIDLGVPGVDANDIDDGDGGANNLQNFPVLSWAAGGEETDVEGMLDSDDNQNFGLEFFASPECDPSGHGEGRSFLATLGHQLAPAGSDDFAVDDLSVASPVGGFMSATATDPNGSTSEFAECIQIAGVQITGPDFVTQKQLPISWTGVVPSPFTIQDYDIRYRWAAFRQDFGPLTDLQTDTASTSDSLNGTVGATYCFSGRLDTASPEVKETPWGAEGCTAIPVNNTKFRHRGFTKERGGGYYLNTYSLATDRGARLILGGVEAKHLAIVVTECRRCGKIAVSFAGKVIGKANLKAPGVHKKQVVDLEEFASVKTGKVRVKVISSGKPVKIEGLGVSRG